ncbi:MULTISPECIES: transposase [Streptomyces]|uniref:transposase n=1 Tax=Streptomyces TaxID=1883 RepID=UPI003D12A970
MPAPRKYPPELIERGVRMVRELRRDAPGRSGTVRQVGEVLHIHPEVLRHWVKKADAETDKNRDLTKAETLHLHQLEQENQELRRVNGILKAAALLFATELEERKAASDN